MSTLKQLSELILKRHNGGQLTSDRFITQRQVILHILQARDALIRQDLYESMKIGEKELDPAFLWTYKNLVPQYDSEMDIYYIDLPVNVASLPNDMGLYSVRPMKGFTAQNKTEYIRVPNGSWGIMPDWYEGLMVYTFKGGKRVEFPNMGQMQAQTQLVADLVPESIQGISDTDPLPMPSYMEDIIVRKVLELIGIGKFDSVNDQ